MRCWEIWGASPKKLEFCMLRGGFQVAEWRERPLCRARAQPFPPPVLARRTAQMRISGEWMQSLGSSLLGDRTYGLTDSALEGRSLAPWSRAPSFDLSLYISVQPKCRRLVVAETEDHLGMDWTGLDWSNAFLQFPQDPTSTVEYDS